ncbi:MAG: tape measure protein, partial [Shewanella oncorhynchi]
MSYNLGSAYYTVDARTEGLLEGSKKVESATNSMNRNFDKTDKIASKLTATFAAITAALSTSKVIAYADAWAVVNNKLANSVKQNEKLADVTERVFNIAQNTRSSVDATANLYQKLERSTRNYNVSASELVTLTETINKGFIVSGATVQEAETAITQLGQGLAAGALRGDEFNTVNENGNRLIIALADSMGRTTGEMRKLAEQGKLTTDTIVKGLLKQANTIDTEYNKTIATFAQNTQKAEQN